MFSHWSLCDSKSPHVSKSLVSILTDLNNTVIWMVSTRPLVSILFISLINPLGTVPCASAEIGITVTFMFHSSLSSLARPMYLSFFSLSFSFTLWSAGTVKSTFPQVLFFVDSFYVWSSGGNLVFLLVSQVPEKFERLIFQDKFRVFPVYHFPDLFMSRLILILR